MQHQTSCHFALSKRLLASAFFSACVLCSLAETAPPTLLSTPATISGKLAGPRIQFAEPNFDFGKADSGTLVKHEYIFTNTGDQTLEVTNVRPGCGCTTAGAWDKVVEPGKTGIIPVQFNSGGYSGNVLKTIAVSCNDPTQTNLTLQLKGTIWKAIDVMPMYAMFNLGPDVQTNETKVVRIVSNAEESITVSEPVWSNSTFQVALQTVKEGKEFELRVTMLPPVASPNVTVPITLKTSSPKMPVLTVIAYAIVQPAVAVNPPQVMLPGGPLASVTKPTVTIQNNSTNALVLTEPSITAPGAEIELKETQPGRMFTLTLNFPAGFQNQPGHTIEATVKSSHPKFPIIKVPIYQLPAPAAPAPPPKTAAATPATVSAQNVSAAAQAVPAAPASK